jgi:hypothetical protein
MINNIETFIKKTTRALDRNVEMQDLLSEVSMRFDKAQEYQAKLLKYVEESSKLSSEDMDKFCKKNQGTLDIILNEQTFIMDDIKNMVRAVDSYAMDSFLNQNTLSHLYHIHKVKADSRTPILGKAMPAQQYYDYNQTNMKGN